MINLGSVRQLEARSEYTYAVSRLRAMENRKIDTSAMQQMAEAESFESAWKLFIETCYGQWIAERGNNSSYDSLLEAELSYTYGELRKFVPDPQLVQLFQIPYDFHNLKVILKGMFAQREGGKSRWDLLVSMGSYPADDMILAVESEDYRLLPHQLHRIIPSCVMIWEQTKNILEIEQLLDRHMFYIMRLIADELPYNGVKEYVRFRIDGENIRTMLRLKRMNADASQMSNYLHSGGTYSTELLAQLYAEPKESWARELAFGYMGRILDNVEEMDASRILPEIEKRSDGMISKYLNKYQYDPFASEQVLRFLWLKETEVKNLRIILVGKASGVEKDMIKGLLRHAA
ncbi:MAG: V-type ATPase subunit [Acetomicrobium sp.]|nr:V-type ATPase subunit [Acetomicrobium sp.]